MGSKRKDPFYLYLMKAILYIHKYIFHIFQRNYHCKKNGKERNILFWNGKERNVPIGKERSVCPILFQRPCFSRTIQSLRNEYRKM